MTKENKLVLAFAAVWIAIKVLSTQWLGAEKSLEVGSMANILFILLISFLVLWIKYKKVKKVRPFDFIQDIKSVMRPNAKYVLVVCAFIWVNHTIINPDYLEGRIALEMAQAEEQYNDPEAMAEAYAQNPTLKDATKEELMESKREQVELFFKPFFIVTFSFVALFALSIIYSILVVIFFRKILQKHLYPRTM